VKLLPWSRSGVHSPRFTTLHWYEVEILHTSTVLVLITTN
jgi:hypothetical protein